ncbi:MAG TPA: phosphate acyltransferase PlsX [Elusimicrobiota bacterium]|nr:phosphate acyltransferase PlsX [Elusimicrobiota bacterium]
MICRIALDAMGGDLGPSVNIEGAIQAARETGHEIILVGDQSVLERELKKHDIGSLPITIHHAPTVIGMDEKPVEGCRAKQDSTIMIGAQMVSDKKADALVSAGNSGATMTAALWHMRRIPGVSRPAIATTMPTLTSYCLLLDAGANVECKPKHLYQFALMGNIYAETVMNVDKPRVGILTIGEEEGKGNELTVAASELMRTGEFNFIGNVEGRDIPKGTVDVVVCDGFVGNIVLKFAEGLAEALLTLIKRSIKKHPLAVIGGLLMKGAFRDIKKKVDYAEYGGAPLLGVNGVAIISHGGSNAKAIKNAIRLAGDFVTKGTNRKIHEKLNQHRLAEPNSKGT